MAVIHPPAATAAAPAPVPIPTPAAPPIALLLVEPQFLLRRTVAAVARDLRLAEPSELRVVEAAAQRVAARRYDALFLSLDEEEAALELMALVRQGRTRCDAGTPIVVTAAACTPDLAMRLKTLEVRRLLLRPFKVKDVLDAIASLRALP